MKRCDILFAAALLFAFAGCDGSTSAEYRQERSDENYQRGVNEYRAGRIDEAVKYLSEAIRSSPANASARFQMAVILQEAKKDYLGALCNYTEYIRIAEDRDKASIARDRKIICEKLLLAALAADNGIGVDRNAVKELETAKADLAVAEKRIAELTAKNEKDAKRLGTLERENASLSRMLKRLGDTEDESVSARPAKIARPASSIQDNAQTSLAVKTAAAAAVDASEKEKPLALNPEAKALFEQEEEEGRASGSSILPQAPRVKGAAKETAGNKPETSPNAFYKTPGNVARPEFYIVEHGDTLMKIAKKFYGDKSAWKKIREANKSVVPVSGGVKAGDKLRLP